ncbi:MAG: flavin reductase family protein [Candidatus Promineifilaceae bacterium]|nr:flavin reductase family protein [Candidatus Promineifilaceae bacterium]
MRQKVKKWLRRLVGEAQGKAPSDFMRVAYSTPRQVVLLTARRENVDNVWPVDWHIPLSEEPELYGLSASRNGFGTAMIKTAGAFVVNFVPASWEEIIFYCGTTSGQEVDKFMQAGLVKEEAQTIDAPRLAEALGWLECRVEQCHEVGDHIFFVGRVTAKAFSALESQNPRQSTARLYHLYRGVAPPSDSE